MPSINVFQKLIVGMAAVTVGLRLFFPVTHQSRYGQETDVGTTLLQLAGMLVVFAAAFYLASTTAGLSLRRFSRRGSVVLVRALVVFAWVGFLVATGIGVRRFGFATSLEAVQWHLLGGTLAALVSLVWITWLAFYRRDALPSGRRRRYNFAAISLVALLVAAGYFGQFLDRAATGREGVRDTQEGQPLSSEEFARAQALVANMRTTGKKYTDLSPKGKDLFDRYRAHLEGRRPAATGSLAYSPTRSAWQALLQFRAAYPEYNDFDDATLARRIIARYPRCRQMFEEVAVSFPPGVKTIVAARRFVLLPECVSK